MHINPTYIMALAEREQREYRAAEYRRSILTKGPAIKRAYKVMTESRAKMENDRTAKIAEITTELENTTDELERAYLNGMLSAYNR